MIRIKICGVTTIEDAQAAADAGADAIGLVFVAGSKRGIDPTQARNICLRLPPFVSRVGLFMDHSAEQVNSVLSRVPLDTLQFHGSETAAQCALFGRPWIKAMAMGGEESPDWNAWQDAQALLLDSHGGGKLGGSGKRFDWSRVPALSRPWILAGGLNPHNVAGACRQLRPDAVDVSSGVEKSPGIKDHKLMHEFIKAVRNA